MTKCPKCGNDVEKPVKSWTLRSGRANTPITMNIFVCPKCNNKFKAGTKQTAS